MRAQIAKARKKKRLANRRAKREREEMIQGTLDRIPKGDPIHFHLQHISLDEVKNEFNEELAKGAIPTDEKSLGKALKRIVGHIRKAVTRKG